jgi:LPXTG-site transpeptidase (sortase) family protein
MNKIKVWLMDRHSQLMAIIPQLQEKLKSCPRRLLIGVPAGILTLSCVAVVIAVTASQEPEVVSLRSPQYEVQEAAVQFDTESKQVYSADDGVIVIPAAVMAPATTQSSESAQSQAAETAAGGDTDAIWEADKVVTYNSFTVYEKAEQADGSLGVLSIPAISLNDNVYHTESELESMTKGIAHFAHTSVWDGNIGLCSHNINYDLSDGYFKNLHLLKEGDEVRLNTELGERIYAVTLIKEIPDTDWTGLSRTPDNRVSMITCVSGKPEQRLLVQAVEKR